MLRHGRHRSMSTPRLARSGRSTTPSNNREQRDQLARGSSAAGGGGRNKDAGDRPAWDDTQGNWSKYKATPEEIARRKQQRVSKHFITSEACLRRLSTGNDVLPASHLLSRDQDTTRVGDAPPHQHHGPANDSSHRGAQIVLQLPSSSSNHAATATGHLQPALTPLSAGGAGGASSGAEPAAASPSPSPPINYGAVLRLLQQQRPSPSPPASSHGPRDAAPLPPADPPLALEASFDQQARWRGDAWRASDAAAAAGGTHETEPSRGSAEVLDATLRPFSLAADPAGSLATSAAQQPAALPAADAPPQQEQEHPHGPPGAPVAAAAFSAPSWGGLQRDTAALGGLAQPQQLHASAARVEGRLSDLEGQVRVLGARHEEQQRQLSLLGASSEDGATAAQRRQGEAQAQAAQLRELRQACRELQEEQAALRAQLSDFTQHAGGIISRLQTQVQQLLSLQAQAQQQQQQVQPVAAVATAARGWAGAPPEPPPGPSGGFGAVRQAAYHTEQAPSRNLFMDLPAPQAPPSSSAAAAPYPPSPPPWGGAGPSHLGPSPPASALHGGPPSSSYSWRAQQPQDGRSGHGAAAHIHPQRRGSPASPTFVGGAVASASAAGAGSRPGTAGFAAAVPVNTFDDQTMSLPSYAALRRSSASVTAAPYHARQPPTASPPGAAMDGGAGASQASSAQALSGQRALPAQHLPRALGTAPILSGSSAVHALGPGGDAGGLGGGFALAEPLVFSTVAPDFKIVRVGGGGALGGGTGLTASNSLSLAAHVAAATRRTGAGGGGGAGGGAVRRNS